MFEKSFITGTMIVLPLAFISFISVLYHDLSGLEHAIGKNSIFYIYCSVNTTLHSDFFYCMNETLFLALFKLSEIRLQDMIINI